MSHELRRKNRMIQVETMCKNRIVIKDKLVSSLCYEWGCGRRTVLDYLKILEGCERIKILGKDIHGKEVRNSGEAKEVLGNTG